MFVVRNYFTTLLPTFIQVDSPQRYRKCDNIDMYVQRGLYCVVARLVVTYSMSIRKPIYYFIAQSNS